jgi:glycopeptide antibiotics resistance protein
MLPLRFARLWLAGGVLLVLGVLSGSLAPGDFVEDAMVWNDKVMHALAYIGLTLWFTGIFPRRRYAWVVLALFLLGATIEAAQGSMSFGRQGDYADLLANGSGILLGLLLAVAGCGGWAQGVEARLTRLFGS